MLDSRGEYWFSPREYEVISFCPEKLSKASSQRRWMYCRNVEHLSINLFVVHPSSLRKCFTKSLWLKRDNIIFPGGKPIFPPGIQHYLNKIDKSIFPGGIWIFPPGICTYLSNLLKKRAPSQDVLELKNHYKLVGQS